MSLRNHACQLAMLATSVFAPQAAGGEPLIIVENGQPRAAIVHNGNDQPASCLAPRHVQAGHIKAPAVELQFYLKAITGAELPIVATEAEAGDKAVIVFELVDKVPGASNNATARQAYLLKTEGRCLRLIAAHPIGLHYAVYGFLEDHLGCRFYTFQRKGLGYAGRGFEITPRRPTLALPNLNDLQEPAFANRGIIYWLGSYPWILQNRGIGLPGDHASGALAACHNLYGLLPPQDKKDDKGNVVVQGLFAQHPEFYPLKADGKRQTDWAFGICGTNPDLPKFLAEGLKREIKRRIEQAGGGPIDWSFPFAVAQGDGFSGCLCQECRKLVHDEQSEAAPLILAINRTLEILGKEYPEARVITFSYFETLDAPKTLKPHSNLWINVVSSSRSQNMAGDQIGPIADNPANRDYARALQEWPKIAPGRVTVWHWDSYRAEWPSIFSVAQNVRYWQRCDIYGVNPQFCGGPWVDLLAWLYLKLLWNPAADDAALVRQYCEDNFGKEAGAYVCEYLNEIDKAYRQNLHVPSAVRWSGWTPLLRSKYFPPSRLARMTEIMDKALAAAEKAGDQVRLANLRAARGQSLDIVILDEVEHSGKPWGPVRYADDSKEWFVAGADPRVPPALMRARQGIVGDGGGEHGILRTLSSYAPGNGGPLFRIEGKTLRAAVCPDLRGQIVSVVDTTTDKELLANNGAEAGYCDLFSGIAAQIWLPPQQANDIVQRPNDDWARLWSDHANPHTNAFETELVLSPPYYGFDPSRRLRRAVRVTDAGLRIERTYTGKPDNPNRFTVRWRFALPNPTLARVALKGGGIDELLDLRYAIPGGIKGVKAGERLPGLDAMDERFDTVIAVPDAEPMRRAFKHDSEGEFQLILDRGDGLAAVLATPSKGWEAVEIKAIIAQNYLEATLIGAVVKAEGDISAGLALPLQTLSAKSVPTAKDATSKSASPDKSDQATAAAKLKITSATTAVNERDGAELVWIPAGEFVRGSEHYEDERPQKKIRLDGFWIYKTPVTLAQYKKFCEATGRKCEPPWGQAMHADPKGDADQYPVQCNWYEAEAYAKWAGAALPTEAQWEKAARGTDGREFPWGNEWEPDKCASMEETIYKFCPGFRPVGSYPQGASPYGVLDMAGNVWEWVADWYDHEYYQNAPDENPPGPAQGCHKVLRGGCSLYDERSSRCAARLPMPPHVRDWTCTGFRCVIQTPGPEAK